MNRVIGLNGKLSAKLIRSAKPTISWRIRNTMRGAFILGWLINYLAYLFSKITGVITITAELKAVLCRADGTRVNYGVLSRRLITDAGVAFLADDWMNDTADITNMKYHGCGTGSVAENKTDTALGTECTTVLNPDSTRATGTQSQPSAWILQSVGTLSFDGTAAVTEHGLLSQAATGGGTLWDRSVFTAINVGNGDSIQFTYQCTLNSNG